MVKLEDHLCSEVELRAQLRLIMQMVFRGKDLAEVKVALEQIRADRDRDLRHKYALERRRLITLVVK